MSRRGSITITITMLLRAGVVGLVGMLFIEAGELGKSHTQPPCVCIARGK